MKDVFVEIAKRINKAGGRMFVVGGAVRDQIRGVAPVDFDFMVSGIWQSDAVAIFAEFGQIVEDEAIKNAPVFIVKIDGEDFEVAMARKEIDVAPGKQGFAFISNPSISPQEDAVRRDFTIGAIFMELPSMTIFDPFGGQSDVERGVIRHVSAETFVQSPERVFRGAAQSARFGFVVDNETLELMRVMKKDAHLIAAEQIWRHIEKAGKQSNKPFFFLDVLVKSGWINLFPEIKCAKAAKALFDLEKQSDRGVVDFVAALIAGMSYEQEMSFFERICCPKQVVKKAVEIKHFGADGKPVAWVQGRDLLHLIPPGERLGQAIKWCWIGQINGLFSDKIEAVMWIDKVFIRET